MRSQLRDNGSQRPANQVQDILGALRQLILDGELPANARLREVELANQFGVSRTPIREALVALEKEGLVTYALNRGFSVRTFSVSDLIEAYEIRGLLEGHACRVVAEGGLPSSIERKMLACIEAVDAMLRSTSEIGEAERKAWQMHNAAYHRLLLSEIRNQFFHRSLETVQKIPMVQHAITLYHSLDLLAFYNEQHRAILDAIVHREGARAEHLMREHIRHACEYLSGRPRPATRSD